MKDKVEKKEWELLVNLCRTSLSGNSGGFDFDLMQSVDWQKVNSLSKIHDVRPLVYKAIKYIETSTLIPEWFVHELEQFQSGLAQKCLDHTRELLQLIREFRVKGIEVIPYKGVLLAKEVYGDWSARTISDLDILIDFKDLPGIAEVLQGKGYTAATPVPQRFQAKLYRRSCEYNFSLFRNGSRIYHIEPHWKLGKRIYQLDIDYHQMEVFTEENTLMGTKVKSFNAEGWLISTALHHGGKDQWRSLKSLCDIGAILIKFKSQINWSTVISKCEELRIKNIVLLGLGASSDLLAIELPDKVKLEIEKENLKSIIEKTILELSLSHTYFKIGRDFNEEFNYHMKLRKNFSTRAKITLYHLHHFIFLDQDDLIRNPDMSSAQYRWLAFKKPFKLAGSIIGKRFKKLFH